MILQIDSAAIQETVQTISKTGLSLLPPDWQILAPALSSIITIITAAIIRAWEKNKIRREQRQEMKDLIQVYLQRDETALHDKINEIQKKNL